MDDVERVINEPLAANSDFETSGLFDAAINIDKEHIPAQFRREFWAFFNRNATTAILSESELAAIQLEADIYMTMNLLKYPPRELARKNLYTAYMEVPAAILIMLSRTRRGKLYEYAVSSISVNESIERKEQEKKRRWFL
jgi:hypothetical protein